MKCPECGARVKQHEEICPECGKYIPCDSKEHDIPIQPDDIDYEKLEAAEAEVRKADVPETVRYLYKDYLILPTLLKGGFGLFVIIMFFVTMIGSPRARLTSSYTSMVFVLLFAGFSIFSAVASVIQERNCCLDIGETKVSGVIPKGTFDTESFEFEIDDIVAVEETGFHSKHSTPKVIIISAENRVEVRGSSKTMLSDFSDTLNRRIGK